MPGDGSSFAEVHYFNGYMLHRPLSWYSSLFEDARNNGKIVGEKTPDYAILSEQHISLIHSLNPDLKVILLLRRPDERSWSHAKMEVSKYNEQSLNDSQVNRLIMHTGTLRNILRTDYLKMLDRWLKFFPCEQVLVGFTDEIAHDPNGLLRRAYRLVGADPQYNFDVEEVKKRIWSSPELGMPDAARWYLQRKYQPMVVELAKRYPDQVNEWLEPDYNTVNLSFMEKIKTLFMTQVLTIPENTAYRIYLFLKNLRLARRIRVIKSD